MISNTFSWRRFSAVMYKEFVQMRRDRLTFGMMVGIPVMQLLLFGFAINLNPKHLPTGIILTDQSPQIRSFLASLGQTGYFEPIIQYQSEDEATNAMAEGDVQFIINIPANFTRDMIRDLHPTLLIQADATDPAATGNAINTIKTVVQQKFMHNPRGPLQHLQAKAPAVNMIVQNVYNPQAITQYNIVPGLLGVILTMTMIMITALSITREKERGTMENMLATPVRPVEVMCGKIMPYIIFGYVQVSLILLAAQYIFNIPLRGTLLLLLLSCLPFIATNLAVGVTFSTIAKNQLQAVQFTIFFFLPSILLSGFMFPFHGMPQWAQYIGQALPLTHFLRIVRGIYLKGLNFTQIWPSVWPLLIMMVVVIFIGTKKYKQTLD